MEILALTLVLASPDCDLFQGGRRERSEYLEIASLYRSGDAGATARFGALDHAQIATELLRLEGVNQSIRNLEEEIFPPDEACLSALSLLHVHAGTEALRSYLWAASTFHFDSAWRVSNLIPSPGTRTRFQRDLLLAMGLTQQESVFTGSAPDRGFTEADRFLATAVSRYPDDPEVLLAHGALLEWAGSLRWADPARSKEALSRYRRILDLDPGNAEALIRYGWTLRRLREDREAAGAFSRVLSLPAPDYLIYRSRMGLGGVAEKSGRLEEAIEHYQEAARLIPGWQVAYIAWSHALHRSGAHARARAVLERSLGMAATREALDGWWSYELGLVPRLEPLLDRMRAQVTK